MISLLFRKKASLVLTGRIVCCHMKKTYLERPLNERKNNTNSNIFTIDPLNQVFL